MCLIDTVFYIMFVYILQFTVTVYLGCLLAAKSQLYIQVLMSVRLSVCLWSI